MMNLTCEDSEPAAELPSLSDRISSANDRVNARLDAYINAKSKFGKLKI
jgi:hypothetical protein